MADQVPHVRYAMRRLAKAKRIGRVSVGFWGRVAVRSACVLIVERAPATHAGV